MINIENFAGMSKKKICEISNKIRSDFYVSVT